MLAGILPDEVFGFLLLGEVGEARDKATWPWEDTIYS